LQSYIIFDVFAVLPMYAIFGNGNLKLTNTCLVVISIIFILQLTKTRKFYDLSEIYRHSGLKLIIIRIVTVIPVIAFIIHMFACAWYALALVADYGPDTWISRSKTDHSLSNDKFYSKALYWALATLTTVGYGDLSAYTNEEFELSIIWMLFGVIVYTWIISTLTTILTTKGVKQA
jgi:hypothetical protein